MRHRSRTTPLALGLAFLAASGLTACDGNPELKKDAGTTTDSRTADSGLARDATGEAGSPAGEQKCGTCHAGQAASATEGPHGKLQQGCVSCHDNALKHQADPGNVTATVDFSVDTCATCHASYKDTYLTEDGKKAGKYGGSVKTSKYDEFPKYKHLMGGHGFTLEYNEDRGHAYMLKDHKEIRRKQNTACLQCKSTAVTYFWNESRRGKPVIGKDMAWDKVIEKINTNWSKTTDYGAGCNHCHDPHSAGFRLVRKAQIAAIMERGTDPYSESFNFVPKTPAELMAKMNEKGADGKRTQAARRMAGILTCAQCHVEYTCGPGVDKTIIRDDFPWRKLKDLESYYQAKYNNVQDWKHSTLGVTGIKAQHPETEFYWDSKHYKAGATCADCHMPKTGTQSSHWYTSPLKYPKETCGKCHGDGQDNLSIVTTLQDGVMNQAKQVETDLDAVLTKLEALGSDPTFDAKKLAEAKGYYMRALFWWEFTVVSENSAGFHNAGEADTNLKFSAGELAKAKAAIGM